MKCFMKNLYKKYGIKNGTIPTKIIKICNDFGFQVYRQDLDKSELCYMFIGASDINPALSDRVMCVPKDCSASTRRIMLGYMLAQFLIYGKKALSVEGENFFTNLFEDKQVLEFILDLFLPQSKLKADYHLKRRLNISHELTMVKLAKKYLVPINLVEYRLNQIFEPQYISQKENNPDEEAKRISLELPKK